MSKTNRREFIKKVAYVAPALIILGSLKAEAHTEKGFNGSKLDLDKGKGNETNKHHKTLNKS
jgi:hypothetical protein